MIEALALIAIVMSVGLTCAAALYFIEWFTRMDEEDWDD